MFVTTALSNCSELFWNSRTEQTAYESRKESKLRVRWMLYVLYLLSSKSPVEHYCLIWCRIFNGQQILKPCIENCFLYKWKITKVKNQLEKYWPSLCMDLTGLPFHFANHLIFKGSALHQLIIFNSNRFSVLLKLKHGPWIGPGRLCEVLHVRPSPPFIE